MTQQKNQPSHNVHVKVYKGIESRIGAQIGVAFPHGDGQGLNVILDASPIPTPGGQIELILFSTERDA